MHLSTFLSFLSLPYSEPNGVLVALNFSDERQSFVIFDADNNNNTRKRGKIVFTTLTPSERTRELNSTIHLFGEEVSTE